MSLSGQMDKICKEVEFLKPVRQVVPVDIFQTLWLNKRILLFKYLSDVHKKNVL